MRSENNQEKGEPVITQSFASSLISPGEVWQVYLNATDEDGDMNYILCEVYQAGMGDYPLTFIKVPDDQQRHLSGYIYLPPAGIYSLNFLNLSLKVTIQDSVGHYSESVSFALTFDSRAKQEKPPAGVFQERELGPIMVNLTLGGIPPGP
ncbi:MAG: hypothetical protein ACUVWV_10275 [Thermodesulfobacteriota bacterium]